MTELLLRQVGYYLPRQSLLGWNLTVRQTSFIKLKFAFLLPGNGPGSALCNSIGQN